MAPKQLRDMLTDLRAELGQSLNVAHGVNDRDTLLYYLNRTQIRLYQEYDWPQLVVYRDTLLAPGQRYYAYPSDLAFDDINRTWLFAPQPIQEVFYGIGPAEYAGSNSDQSAPAAWPVRKWMHSPDQNMFEVWPVPDGAAATIKPFLRMWGTKTVTKMVNDSDVSTLPDNLIVLFCAAELLARDKTADAQMKLQQANEAMRRHRVRQATHKSQPFVIGGQGGDGSTWGGTGRRPVIGLDYIPPGYGSGPA
jgi:hypothetical protein